MFELNKKIIIFLLFISSTFLWSQQHDHESNYDLNLLQELLAFHGPNWEGIIQRHRSPEKKIELKKKLQFYALNSEKIYPHDEFRKKLNKNNAILGLGFISNQQHQLNDSDIRFYKILTAREQKNRQENPNEHDMASIYQSLTNNASFQALQLLGDLYQQEKEPYYQLMILNNSLEFYTQPGAHQTQGDLIYTFNFHPHRSVPYDERSKSPWGRELKKIARKLLDLKKNNTLTKKEDRTVFNEALERSLKQVNLISQQKQNQSAIKPAQRTVNNSGNNLQNNGKQTAGREISSVQNSGVNNLNQRYPAQQEQLPLKNNDKNNPIIFVLGLMILGLILFLVKRYKK